MAVATDKVLKELIQGVGGIDTSELAKDATLQSVERAITELANAVKPDASDIPYDSNLSVKGKIDAVINSIYPDYANVTTLHTGANTTTDITTNGTIASNGFLQAKVITSGTSGSPFIRVKINGLIVFDHYNKYNNTYIYGNTPFFPVKRGDVYSITTGTNGVASGTYSIVFYPTI